MVVVKAIEIVVKAAALVVAADVVPDIKILILPVYASGERK